jgi:hypothetical protein
LKSDIVASDRDRYKTVEGLNPVQLLRLVTILGREEIRNDRTTTCTKLEAIAQVIGHPDGISIGRTVTFIGGHICPR